MIEHSFVTRYARNWSNLDVVVWGDDITLLHPYVKTNIIAAALYLLNIADEKYLINVMNSGVW